MGTKNNLINVNNIYVEYNAETKNSHTVTQLQ